MRLGGDKYGGLAQAGDAQVIKGATLTELSNGMGPLFVKQ
jgi:hypothetical protein